MKNQKMSRRATSRRLPLKEELIDQVEKSVRSHVASRELTVDLADVICRRVEYLQAYMQGHFDAVDEKLDTLLKRMSSSIKH